MPIQAADVKLLQSAVMADVAEGGGAMTGVPIADGVSNAMFPDVSSDARASGRVELRKVFGAVQTADTDVLLGGSFAVIEGPADPLIGVTIFETPVWADTRTQAVQQVERYLSVGPRMYSRLLDTHYAGTLALQMYMAYSTYQGSGDFPGPGDAIVLRNPNGSEEYVRVSKTTVKRRSFSITVNGQLTPFDAALATVELTQPISIDLLGLPMSIAEPSNYATQSAIVYTTTVSSPAKFYGVKPLKGTAAQGDRVIEVLGGIYAPLVPSATQEVPLIEQRPLLTRAGISTTGTGSITLPSASVPATAGTSLLLPTAAVPGTVSINAGGNAMTVDASGTVRFGAQVVGTCDHLAGVITYTTTVINGNVGHVLSYTPASRSGGASNSKAVDVTTANAGLVWTDDLDPPPGRFTVAVSYMANGTWIELTDNGQGQLTGTSEQAGTGQVDYATGSLVLTLGAVPDVGSALVLTWAAQQAAVQLPAGLPDRLAMRIDLSSRPAVMPGTLQLQWSRGGTPYTATVAANGTVTGPAQVNITADEVVFSPNTLPDGAVTVAYTGSTPASVSGGTNGQYTIAGAPLQPRSVRCRIPVVRGPSFAGPAYLDAYDDGAGTLLTMADPISNPGGAPVAVGSVNYTTGALSIVATTPAVFSGWLSQGFSYATVGGSSTSASYSYTRYFVQPT